MRFLALLLLLVASPSWAQGSATLSCTPPTTNVGGTPITGPISYRFYRGTTLGTYPASQTAATCATVFTALAAGTYFFVATATVAGVESVFSGPASKVIPIAPAVPNPPTQLTVLPGKQTVYTIATTEGAIAWLEVGTVPAGTPFDLSQYVRPFGMGVALCHVPETAVTYLQGASALVTFAECGGG